MSIQELNLIKRLLLDKIRDEKIPRDVIKHDNADFHSFIHKAIKLKIIYLALVLTKVKDGGKVEDARFFLQLICKNGWRIPIRDLDTFEVISQTSRLEPKSECCDNISDLSSHIFWFSLQNVINFAVICGLQKEEFFHSFIYKGRDGKRV